MEISYARIVEKTGKPVDAWWVKFFADPIAIVLTGVILRVSPQLSANLVTTGSLVLGIAAAAMFYESNWLIAAVLYQGSFVLDCVDGKVARMQGRATKLGAFYDGLVNHLVYIASLIGLGCGVGSGTAYAIVIVLLAARSINSFLNETLVRPTTKTWSHFVPRDSSWLARRGLLPPGSFPDKHALLFLAFPLLGRPVEGMVLILGMDLLLIAMKVRKAIIQAREVDLSP
jgi:hypothetical protein